MMNRASRMLRIVVFVIVALRFNNDVLAQSPHTTLSAPVMNEELMGRLIKYTRSYEDSGNRLVARVCKILDLCDGTMDLPLHAAKSDSTDGSHYFALPLEPDSKDILILVMRDTILEAYLTDKTGKLRAAAISENSVARLITNEKAAEKFKAELALFAKEANDQLPPTAADPGKN
jgi:hypothetical protein